MFWRSPTKKAHQPPSHQEEPIRCFFPQKSTYNSLPPAINVEITVLSAVSPFLRSCTLMASGNAHKSGGHDTLLGNFRKHITPWKKGKSSTQLYLCQGICVRSQEVFNSTFASRIMWVPWRVFTTPNHALDFFSGKSLKMTIDILHRVSSPPKNGVLFISSV